jgi:hypothetical protein
MSSTVSGTTVRRCPRRRSHRQGAATSQKLPPPMSTSPGSPYGYTTPAGSPELSSTHHLKLSWSATCTKDALSALIPSCRIVSSTATNPTHASTTSHPEAIRPGQGGVAAGPRTGEHPDRPPTATGAEFTTGRNAASGGIPSTPGGNGGPAAPCVRLVYLALHWNAYSDTICWCCAPRRRPVPSYVDGLSVPGGVGCSRRRASR